MRYVAMAIAMGLLGACAQQQPSPAASALGTAYELYQQCLAAMPPEQCETPRARFEAARAYADSVSRREAVQNTARPPLVLRGYTPPAPVQPPRQPITCTTYGNMTNCF